MPDTNFRLCEGNYCKCIGSNSDGLIFPVSHDYLLYASLVVPDDYASN